MLFGDSQKYDETEDHAFNTETALVSTVFRCSKPVYGICLEGKRVNDENPSTNESIKVSLIFIILPKFKILINSGKVNSLSSESTL